MLYEYIQKNRVRIPAFQAKARDFLILPHPPEDRIEECHEIWLSFTEHGRRVIYLQQRDPEILIDPDAYVWIVKCR